jgi:hypothetical protein
MILPLNCQFFRRAVDAQHILRLFAFYQRPLTLSRVNRRFSITTSAVSRRTSFAGPGFADLLRMTARPPRAGRAHAAATRELGANGIALWGRDGS